MGSYRKRIIYRRQMSKIVFCLLSVTFLLMVFYSASLYDTRKKKEALGLYDRNSHLKRSTKLIASWNTYWGDASFNFGTGYEPFQVNNCPYQDCYFVPDTYNDVIDQYDAVVFHAPELGIDDFPKKRSAFQRYVFFNMVSPQRFPIPQYFNDVFNITMSYRLDSDIPIYNFAFYNIDNDERVSPREDALWIDKNVNEQSLTRFEDILKSKWRPIAFVINECDPNHPGLKKAQELMEFIEVDIIGGCGGMLCSGSDIEKCFEVIEKEYYFYWSYEDVNCVDYVSEKLGNAFLNNIVPIYNGLGGLNKFAPPYSYIDSQTMSSQELAEKIKLLMTDEKEYMEYFWWKDFYKVFTASQVPSDNHFCKLCEMLHNPNLPPKTYEDFHYWWNMYEGLPACGKSTVRW